MAYVPMNRTAGADPSAMHPQAYPLSRALACARLFSLARSEPRAC